MRIFPSKYILKGTRESLPQSPLKVCFSKKCWTGTEQILYLKQNKTKQKPKEQNTSCFKNLILSGNKSIWDHTCVYVWLCVFLYICMKQQLIKRNTNLIKVQSNFDITFSRVLYCFWVPSFILFQTSIPPNFSLGLNFQRLLLLKAIITKIKTKLSACNVFKWNESKYDQ